MKLTITALVSLAISGGTLTAQEAPPWFIPDGNEKFKDITSLEPGLIEKIRWEALDGDGKPIEWQLQSPERKDISSKEYRGKVIILVWFTTWAAPSIILAKEFNDLHKTYESADVIIIGMSADQDLSGGGGRDSAYDPNLRRFTGGEAGQLKKNRFDLVNEFVKNANIQFPVLMLNSTKLPLNAFPSVMIFDKNGNCIEAVSGRQDMDTYKKLIQEAQNKK